MKRKELLRTIAQWVKFWKQKNKVPEISEVNKRAPLIVGMSVKRIQALIIREEDDRIFREIITRIGQAARDGQQSLVVALEGVFLDDEQEQEDFFEKLWLKIPNVIREIHTYPPVRIGDERFRLTFVLSWKLRKK